MITGILVGLLSRLPGGLDAPIGLLAGTLAYLAATRARAAVRANLAIVVPERRDREALVRATFVWQVRHYLETFRLARLDRSALERAIRVVGWEHLESALARGKGVVVASGHLGPVSVCGQALVVRGVEVTLPVERETSELSRLVNRARTAMGLRFVPTDSALGIGRVLRAGGVLAILADRAVTGVGVRVPFAGREALLPSAPVVLALRTGAPLIVAFAERERDTLVARFEPELALPHTGDHEADVREGVRRYAERLATAIRRAPQEWSVFEHLWNGKAA